MTEEILHFNAIDQAVSLFGSNDENIKLIEKEFTVSIISRGSDLKVVGEIENVSLAVKALKSLLLLINKGETLSEQNVRYAVSLVQEGNEDKIPAMSSDSICISSKGRPIKPKTIGQKKYCEAIDNNTITFGIGPAGTGKTYLAVAMERGSIEVAPLAYMRGRTLDDSFIILDEAQNTTPEQMKMFLTRLGFNSKMVVTGDITQIDLPDGKKSGLKKVIRILKSVDDIEVCKFSQKDVVRHKLVQDIIKAYEKFENEEKR